MGAELVLSIFGAVTGAVGAVSGVYAFIWSGYRIKCGIGLAASSDEDILVKFWSSIENVVSSNVRLMPNSTRVYVDVWNRGRMPISIDQLRICHVERRRWHTWGEGKYRFVSIPPVGFAGMPHRLDPGSSCTWLIPFADVADFSKGEAGEKPFDVRASIYLGDSKWKRSKNVLTSGDITDFNMQWSQYVNKQTSSEEVLDHIRPKTDK